MTAAVSGPPARRPVALLLPGLHGGGAERVTLNLARGLRDRGVAVDLVLASTEGEYRDQVPESVEIVDLGGRRMLRSLPSLAAYLRRRAPAALLSAMSHANVIAIGAAVLARYRSPVVVCEHTEVLPASRRPARQRVLVATMRRTYPHARRVVAVSEGVKRSLVRELGLRPERVDVVYNPVIASVGSASTVAAAVHPFFEGRYHLVLSMGRLTPAKGFADLVRAFARVRERHDAKLIVLGEGEQRGELQALITALGLGPHVSLPGFIANPSPYLGRASVFALASEMEGLPTVLIEALAAGAHVVATDCSSGVREVLANGRYGSLVPVHDITALSEAIEVALGLPARVVDERWLERFTVSSATERYMALLGLRGRASRASSEPAQ